MWLVVALWKGICWKGGYIQKNKGKFFKTIMFMIIFLSWLCFSFDMLVNIFANVESSNFLSIDLELV